MVSSASGPLHATVLHAVSVSPPLWLSLTSTRALRIPCQKPSKQPAESVCVMVASSGGDGGMECANAACRGPGPRAREIKRVRLRQSPRGLVLLALRLIQIPATGDPVPASTTVTSPLQTVTSVFVIIPWPRG